MSAPQDAGRGTFALSRQGSASLVERSALGRLGNPKARPLVIRRHGGSLSAVVKNFCSDYVTGARGGEAAQQRQVTPSSFALGL